MKRESMVLYTISVAFSGWFLFFKALNEDPLEQVRYYPHYIFDANISLVSYFFLYLAVSFILMLLLLAIIEPFFSHFLASKFRMRSEENERINIKQGWIVNARPLYSLILPLTILWPFYNIFSTHFYRYSIYLAIFIWVLFWGTYLILDGMIRLRTWVDTYRVKSLMVPATIFYMFKASIILSGFYLMSVLLNGWEGVF
ncbi:MAG: hypothetical protein ACTSVI_05105 [Promethearchaeota archaeon]